MVVASEFVHMTGYRGSYRFSVSCLSFRAFGPRKLMKVPSATPLFSVGEPRRQRFLPCLVEFSRSWCRLPRCFHRDHNRLMGAASSVSPPASAPPVPL